MTLRAAAGMHIENCNVHFENCNAPVRHRTRGSKPYVELWCELEVDCNVECRFCYNYWRDGQSARPLRVTTAETIAGLHQLLSAVECGRFALSGGEPLLHPDLDSIIDAVAAHGVPMVLTTNGLLLSPERIDRLSRGGVAAFQVSIHSHRRAVHDWLTNAHSWDAAMAAAAAVCRAGHQAAIVFVATRANIGDFPAMLALCRSIGIPRIIFNRFIPTGLGARNAAALGVADRELIEVLSEADVEAARHEVRIQLGVPIVARDEERARWRMVDEASCPVGEGQHRWTIGPDLRLRRCNHSSAAIGGLADDGVARLLSELERGRGCDETPADRDIHPCRLLKPRLIQVVRDRAQLPIAGAAGRQHTTLVGAS